MNDVKVALPSPTFINFYMFYTYFALAITWLITPLLFYIILTQSQSLKGFKWYIFNHSMWCLFLVNIFCIVKPVFLTPAFAGFPLTLIRINGSFLNSVIFMIFLCCCFTNFFVGLLATLGVRYLMVFPSKMTKYINLKIVTIFAAFWNIAIYSVIIAIVVFNYPKEPEVIHKQAAEYDKFFEDFAEPSLIFVPIDSIRMWILFGFLGGVSICSIMVLVLFLFVYLVLNTLSKSKTKIQKLLIISSVIQILFTILFLILPITIIAAFIAFQISNSVEATLICLSLASSYGIIDFFTTLYFVVPYRKFIKKYYQQFFKQKYRKKDFQIFALSPTSYRNGRVNLTVNFTSSK